jgi:large subunit ribosomal protein L32
MFMAVPKKKMSKSRRDSRKANWNKKITKHVLFAISLGKSFLTSKSKSFIVI